MGSESPRPYKWMPGELRACNCQIYDGELHYEPKRTWYNHQKRQAWLDKGLNSQGSVIPLNIDSQYTIDEDQVMGGDQDMDETENKSSGTPSDISSTIDNSDGNHDTNTNKSEEQEFESASVLGESDGNQAAGSSDYNMGSDIIYESQERDFSGSYGNQMEDLSDYDMGPSIIYEGQKAGHESVLGEGDGNRVVYFGDEVPSSSESLESEIDPAEVILPGVEVLMTQFGLENEDESGDEGEYDKDQEEEEEEDLEVEEECFAALEPYDLESDTDNMANTPPISEYEDYPYESIPNVSIVDPVLKHLRLLKVRMDGNVAASTHKQYMKAFSEISDNTYKICNEKTVDRHLMDITRIINIQYDVCRNNCICFAAFPGSQECHICKEPRLASNGKPYRTFDYIPLIHRLRVMYTDPGYVEKTLEYKTSFAEQLPYSEANPRLSTRDYWDSLLCSSLRHQKGLWADPRDTGFIFSTDGFSLFKIGHFDIWPLLLINMNLSPADRVLKENMILCGIIPGPQNPKDIGSFLTPMIDEFVELQKGVKAWDGLRNETFTLRAHIALIAGDTMAMAKLMKWTGPNSFHYCRFCDIYGVSFGHIYCPLEPPRDFPPATTVPDETETNRSTKLSKKSKYYPEKSWDPNNLPLLTDSEIRSRQKIVEGKLDFVWGKLVGTNGEPVFSRLNSVVYPWTFTPDVMHLIDENTPKLYLAHWMGIFREKEEAATNTDGGGKKKSQSKKSKKARRKSKKKDKKARKENGLDATQAVEERDGPEGASKNYSGLSSRVWGIIGAEIADSRSLFPTAFGKAFRDINKYHAGYKATELLNFMHLVSPIVLNGRLPEPEYNHWHHFVLSAEKARKYHLTMDEIDEMHEDMIKVVTGYEYLYYQFKKNRISACTSQVHGLLHLATAMRICGPSPIYHQYPMERTCGQIKTMCHGRSTANQNLSAQILFRERLKFLPQIAINLPDSFKATPEKGLFGLSEKDKYASLDYPGYLLMSPKVSRTLNQYEQAHLRAYCAAIAGESNRRQPAHTYKQKFSLWGRAVAGKGYSNENKYELVGSKMSNSKVGRAAVMKRDDSYVRYLIMGNDDEDISYFGRVLLYLPFKLPDSEEEPMLLAYVQRIEVGRVRGRKLVYKVRKGAKEFVDLMDLQELVGSIRSRGKEFMISKTSCFWPKKNFHWSEIINNEELFDEEDE